jgi:hypothetical protein
MLGFEQSTDPSIACLASIPLATRTSRVTQSASMTSQPLSWPTMTAAQQIRTPAHPILDRSTFERRLPAGTPPRSAALAG